MRFKDVVWHDELASTNTFLREMYRADADYRQEL